MSPSPNRGLALDLRLGPQGVDREVRCIRACQARIPPWLGARQMLASSRRTDSSGLRGTNSLKAYSNGCGRCCGRRRRAVAPSPGLHRSRRAGVHDHVVRDGWAERGRERNETLRKSSTTRKWAEATFEEIATLGEANVHPIYGDFSGPQLHSWERKPRHRA